MGVPHLTTFLRPFATSANLADAPAVVVDGPGLAYHVWHILLGAETGSRNPFEACPSYEVLGKTAVRYLDELQAHGVCVRKIFFDGCLPSTKRNTRLGRLVGYTKQLNNYHQSWPQIIPSVLASTASEHSAVKLFNVGAVSSSFSRLPAASFLVPAVIEMLLTNERLRSAVEVVPGEADTYCARYLELYGGTVLTGDSDLLVHSLGDGAVTFFRDMEKVQNGNSECIMTIRYEVGDIANRLMLPKSHGMKSLAFEMSLNTHGSFRELLQQATKLSAVSCHENSYREFAAEYQSQMDIGNTDVTAFCSSLKRTDPRISEFLLQFPTFSRTSGISEGLLNASDVFRGIATLFLPFLLDCPCRTSAWEMSTPVRQLAYALTNLVLPIEEHVSIVVEYRRLQNGNRGKEWSVPTVQDVIEICEHLIGIFNQIRDGMPGLPNGQFWRAFAAYQDLALNTGSTKNTFGPFILGTAPPRLTWDAIHSFAQFQGSYYSFRILKQIISAVTSSRVSSLLPPVVYQLGGELESLPSMAQLTGLVDFVHSVGSPTDREIIGLARQILKIEPDIVEAEHVENNKRAKKRKSERVTKNQVLEQRKSKNKFDLLHYA